MMNSVKEKLRKGQVCLGGWIQIGHPVVAEIMAGAGFDWIAIDNEHGIIDLESGMHLLNAMKGTATMPMVRVQENNELIIRRWCDAGAQGIIVPMVNTKEQAQHAVKAAKYPPLGRRGFGFCRANDYGKNFEAHARNHNEDVLLIMQIEHIEAVKNIESILAVEGVDGAFIGPYDLSGSMGITGQLNHPDMAVGCSKMLDACKRSKKVAGIHVVAIDPDKIKACVAQGFTFIAAGIDTVFLQYGAEFMLKMQ